MQHVYRARPELWRALTRELLRCFKQKTWKRGDRKYAILHIPLEERMRRPCCGRREFAPKNAECNGV